MTKAHTPALRQHPQQRQQLPLPFNATDPPTHHVAEPRRTLVVELLRQMLIDVVLAESKAMAREDDKENDHE